VVYRTIGGFLNFKYNDTPENSVWVEELGQNEEEYLKAESHARSAAGPEQ
jgi:hypothetical protein